MMLILWVMTTNMQIDVRMRSQYRPTNAGAVAASAAQTTAASTRANTPSRAVPSRANRPVGRPSLTGLAFHFGKETLAQQSLRTQDERQHEQAEADGVAIARVQEIGGQVLDHAERNASDNRTRDAAKSAQHHDDKRFHSEALARDGRKGIDDSDQRPGHARHHSADPKSQRIARA